MSLLENVTLAPRKVHRKDAAQRTNEITSALDPELVTEVLDVVRALKDDGMTMLIATHEMAFARDVADEVCFLDGGLVLERGTPAEFFARPQEPRTRQFLQRVFDSGRL